MNAPGRSTGELERYVAATWRNFRLIAELGGGRAVAEDGVLLLAGPDPAAAILNTTFRLDPAVPAADVLSRARAFYEPASHFTVCATDDQDADLSRAAEAAGWHLAIELPAMVLRGTARVSDVARARLRRVDPALDRGIFSAVATPAFADDDDEAAAYPLVFDRAAIYEPPCGAVIAELDDQPAACAWFVVSEGVATVGFVATLPAFRRRGLGRLVTAAVCRMAIDAGADLVTLQASPMGLPVYEPMGFETIAREVLWAPPA